MTAKKFDSAKPPLGLIPRSALVAIAEVLRFGAEKYGRDNWRQGMDWTRFTDASLRHIFAFLDGEDLDPESGIHHLAHATCSLVFLLEYIEKETSTDDRYKNELSNKRRREENEATVSVFDSSASSDVSYSERIQRLSLSDRPDNEHNLEVAVRTRTAELESGLFNIFKDQG